MCLSLPHLQRMRVVRCDRDVQSLTNVVREVQSEVSPTISKFFFRFVRHVLILQREIPSLQVRAKNRKHSRCEFNTMRVNCELL